MKATHPPRLLLPQHAAKAGVRVDEAPQTASAFWLHAFVLVQILCQVALLFPQLGAARVVIRTLAFGISLAFLFLLPGRGTRHPAARVTIVALAWLAVQVLHPTTNSLFAAVAHCGLYLAIVAPVFWTSRIEVSPEALQRTLSIVWGFHAVSAVFGILQVLFPGRFQPALSSVVLSQGYAYLKSLHIELTSGEVVLRPMGLSDIPGGAAIAGFYATLFGMGFLISARKWLFQIVCAASILVGMSCIYLSQVRSVLVLVVISTTAMAGLLFLRRQMGRFTAVSAVFGGIAALALLWAIFLGGESVTGRLSTLFQGEATEVYYRNRGHFLTHTIEVLLPEYPLGAGLGRWGMINGYFGDNSDPLKGPIWVEIQWTGWLLDGGVPFILLFVAMIAICFRSAWWVSSLPSTWAGDLSLWGVVLVGYNLGVAALTFSYSPFIGQFGMEFFVLNGALFAAAAQRVQARAARRG